MPQNDRKVVIMEGVQLRYLNFSGGPDKFNPKGGVRGFAVLLDEKVAKAMARDGWPVKVPTARKDDDGEDIPAVPYLKVAVRFDKYPPQVFVITSKNRTQIYESDIAMLDSADMVNVDLIVTPSSYTNRDGQPAIKAYLKSIYVTIEEDYLAQKYAAIDAERNRMTRGEDEED